MKDYMKVIITAVVVCLATLVATSAFNYPSNVNEKIKLVEENANIYTDKAIKIHEDKQMEQLNTIKANIASVKETSEKTNDIVNKLLDLQLNKQK